MAVTPALEKKVEKKQERKTNWIAGILLDPSLTNYQKLILIYLSGRKLSHSQPIHMNIERTLMKPLHISDKRYLMDELETLTKNKGTRFSWFSQFEFLHDDTVIMYKMNILMLATNASKLDKSYKMPKGAFLAFQDLITSSESSIGLRLGALLLYLNIGCRKECDINLSNLSEQIGISRQLLSKSSELLKPFGITLNKRKLIRSSQPKTVNIPPTWKVLEGGSF